MARPFCFFEGRVDADDEAGLKRAVAGGLAQEFAQISEVVVVPHQQ